MLKFKQGKRLIISLLCLILIVLASFSCVGIVSLINRKEIPKAETSTADGYTFGTIEVEISGENVTLNEFDKEDLDNHNKFYISSAAGLWQFANANKSWTFNNKTVYLTCDIDWKNYYYEMTILCHDLALQVQRELGPSHQMYAALVELQSECWESHQNQQVEYWLSGKFSGTFDGQGYTISNLKSQGCGFFKELNETTVKDLNLKDFTIISKGNNRYKEIGAIANRVYVPSLIRGCGVKNFTIECDDLYGGGQGYGGLVGNIARGNDTLKDLSIYDCSVIKFQFLADSDFLAGGCHCTGGVSGLGGFVGGIWESEPRYGTIEIETSILVGFSFNIINEFYGAVGVLIGEAGGETEVNIDNCCVIDYSHTTGELEYCGIVGSHAIFSSPVVRPKYLEVNNVIIRGPKVPNYNETSYSKDLPTPKITNVYHGLSSGQEPSDIPNNDEIRDDARSYFEEDSDWYVPRNLQFNDAWPFLRSFVDFEDYYFAVNNGTMQIDGDDNLVTITVPVKNIDGTEIEHDISSYHSEFIMFYSSRITVEPNAGYGNVSWSYDSSTKTYTANFELLPIEIGISDITIPGTDVVAESARKMLDGDNTGKIGGLAILNIQYSIYNNYIVLWSNDGYSDRFYLDFQDPATNPNKAEWDKCTVEEFNISTMYGGEKKTVNIYDDVLNTHEYTMQEIADLLGVTLADLAQNGITIDITFKLKNYGVEVK